MHQKTQESTNTTIRWKRQETHEKRVESILNKKQNPTIESRSAKSKEETLHSLSLGRKSKRKPDVEIENG